MKLFEMLGKNNLDERQEQAMLKIEHNGCWFAFWALFIVMIIEYIVFGYNDLRAVAGEWVVFMCLAIYLAVDCTRNGIFDRRLKPTAKTYIGSGIIGGVIAGLIMGIVQYKRYPEYVEIAAMLGAIVGIITFGLIVFSLMASAKSIKDKELAEAAKFDDEEKDN